MSDFRTRERHAAKRRPQAEDFAPDAEPRPDATADLFTSGTPVRPGRWHNCKNPCGTDGCLGWLAQLDADRKGEA